MKGKAIYIIIILAVVSAFAWFTADQTPLETAQKSEFVNLADGDSYDLVASYVSKDIGGRAYKMLGYNGSIPGPTIKVAQNSKITINFKNSTDMPALLHSHGVRMNSAFDGSQLAQEEIKPGESFSYELKFPDLGIYWYHPHVNEVYSQALGLYGAFIVSPNDKDYFPPADRDVPLFISDLPIQNGRININKNDKTHALMGHYGNVMLVNGEDEYALEAKVGEVLRLYVINSANARPFNFSISGMRMKLIGGDSGTYEKSQIVNSVILGPSERAIIDVFAENPGEYALQNKTPNKVYSLGKMIVSGEETTGKYSKEFQAVFTGKEDFFRFKKYFESEPDKEIGLTITMDHSMMGGHMMMSSSAPGGIEWEDGHMAMNASSNTNFIKWHIIDKQTGLADMDINWEFEKDKPVKIRIFNDPNSMHPMQHPIHFHGQRFLVLERNGKKEQNLVWKDTVLVKAGETVDVLLDPSNPGDWMAHCHISEHLEAGMMMSFKVY